MEPCFLKKRLPSIGALLYLIRTFQTNQQFKPRLYGNNLRSVFEGKAAGAGFEPA
jgi:hypothetical protein